MTAWARRWQTYLVVALALGLMVPALRVGRFDDDHFHALVLKNEAAGYGRMFSLYSFFDSASVPRLRAGGVLPWWSADELSLRFFRPLSSFDLALDHLLLDGGGLLSHLHSALWFAALIWIVHRLFQTVLGPKVAGFATAFYAILGCHSLPLSFLAARHAHISACLALGSLLCLALGLSSGRRRQLQLHWLLFVAALLSGESAIAVLPIAALYAVSEVGWRRGLRAIAPMLVLAGVYLALYAGFGLGARHSAGYLNPFADPVRFLAALPGRWLSLCADLFVGYPADLSLLNRQSPGSTIGLIALAVLLSVVVWVWRSLDVSSARRLRALLLGALIGLLPLCAGIPGGRLVVIGGVASAALFGVLAERAVSFWAAQSGRVRSVVLSMVVLGPLFQHALFRVAVPQGLKRLTRQDERMAALVSAKCAGTIALAFGGAKSHFFYLAPQLAARGLPRPKSLHVLSMSDAAHTFAKGPQSTFQLSIAGNFLADPWSGIFRDRPLEVGSTVHLRGLDVSVLEQGRRTRLELKLDRSTPVCWISSRGVTRAPQPPATEPSGS